jgi:predicted acyltransferase
LWRGLRYAGFVLMLLLVALFRGKPAPDGTIPGLAPQWWGILGAIGWAYMVASLVYLAVRGRDSGLMGALGLMIALYIGYTHGALSSLPSRLTDWVDPGQLGTLGANATAGALVGNLLLRKDMSDRERVGAMLRLACALYVSGLLLRPLHGISKVGHTDSYSLVASGLNCAAFAVFHALIDIWKVWKPGPLLLGVGRNSLLAYMMPSLWEYAMALLGLTRVWESVAFPYFQSPWPLLCMNAIGVTVFYLGVVYGLGKLGVRLQL